MIARKIETQGKTFVPTTTILLKNQEETKSQNFSKQDRKLVSDRILKKSLLNVQKNYDFFLCRKIGFFPVYAY